MFSRLALFVFTICLALGSAARAETTTDKLVEERLRAGALAQLEQELSARLTASPFDDQVRLALGMTQFLRAVEGLGQDFYRHGLESRELRTMLFLRLPVPENPAPEPLDYPKLRAIFDRFSSALATADETLSVMSTADVKLPVPVALVRLDLNGDGKADENEMLWRVFMATLGGGGGAMAPEDAERFVIAFDRADAAWLRGYTHLLRAAVSFGQAHDWQASFDASFHLFFPRAGLPGALLNPPGTPDTSGFNERPLADYIALFHTMNWPVTDADRMAQSLAHLERVVELSREGWNYILAETDDDAEWIPAPQQRNGVLQGLPVTQETVDGWMLALSEFDGVLKGTKLVPHWRLAQGINLRRVFLEPRRFDAVLWVQGTAALPYLEDGPMVSQESWDRIMGMLGGNALGYAIWFN